MKPTRSPQTMSDKMPVPRMRPMVSPMARVSAAESSTEDESIILPEVFGPFGSKKVQVSARRGQPASVRYNDVAKSAMENSQFTS